MRNNFLRPFFGVATVAFSDVGGHKVTIRGRNLNLEVRLNVRLIQGICRHRVPWIQEADQTAIMEDRNQGVIVGEIEW